MCHEKSYDFWILNIKVFKHLTLLAVFSYKPCCCLAPKILPFLILKEFNTVVYQWGAVVWSSSRISDRKETYQVGWILSGKQDQGLTSWLEHNGCHTETWGSMHKCTDLHQMCSPCLRFIGNTVGALFRAENSHLTHSGWAEKLTPSADTQSWTCSVPWQRQTTHGASLYISIMHCYTMIATWTQPANSRSLLYDPVLQFGWYHTDLLAQSCKHWVYKEKDVVG